MIVITATVRSREGRADELADELGRVARERTEEEEGNRAYLVARSADDPHEFRLFEVYRDQAALDEHLRAVRGSQRPGLGDLIDGPPAITRCELVAGFVVGHELT